jgi:hypothetical protein
MPCLLEDFHDGVPLVAEQAELDRPAADHDRRHQALSYEP